MGRREFKAAWRLARVLLETIEQIDDDQITKKMWTDPDDVGGPMAAAWECLVSRRFFSLDWEQPADLLCWDDVFGPWQTWRGRSRPSKMEVSDA